MVDRADPAAIANDNNLPKSGTSSGLLATRQSSRHKHTADDIVRLANEISLADSAIRHTATGKLSLILEQIQFLQGQAQKILDETSLSQRLHSAACNFRKRAGTIYHLYRRDSGQYYISMLSPEEWGLGLPHAFQGSYRLEADASWTSVDRLAEVTKKNAWAERLMAATDAATTKSSFLAIE